MRRGLFVLLLTLAVGGGPWFAPTAGAGTTVKYPRHDPDFTLEVPADWTAEETTTQLVHPLDFRLKKGRVDYRLQILFLSIADVSDRQAFVRELAGIQARNVGLTGAGYDPPRDDQLHSGLPVTEEAVRGKLGGVDYAYVFVLFVVNGQGYVLAVNGPAAAMAEGTGFADQIAESIRPLRKKRHSQDG